MKTIPNFKKTNLKFAERLAQGCLTKKDGGHFLIDIIEFEDHHFRAIFKPNYFTENTGNQQPTKSQWSTLKKRMKRYNPKIFIFKEYGAVEHNTTIAYFIDFGFFKD